MAAPERPPRRLQINPEALKVVPAERRKFWHEMAASVDIDVAQKFRKKWTMAETVRVLLATPEETYEDVAKELGRTPGAVRYRRMAMVHLLRDEAGATDRVGAYAEDPKTHHKHADYFEVDGALTNLGYYDLPAHQQLELAQPLRQPSKGWRGDGTAATVSGSGSILRDEIVRLIHQARGGDGDDGA